MNLLYIDVVNMPLLERIGLVSVIFLLGAIICIVTSLMALEAFHLTNIPLLGDIIVFPLLLPLLWPFVLVES
jgi:hypothetical protein